MRTIHRYGLDIALAPTPFSGIRNQVESWISGGPTYLTGLSTPAKVRLLLQELGPTYVKFGQMVASQVAGLSEEWAIGLTRLQIDRGLVASVRFWFIKKAIEQQPDLNPRCAGSMIISSHGLGSAMTFEVPSPQDFWSQPTNGLDADHSADAKPCC